MTNADGALRHSLAGHCTTGLYTSVRANDLSTIGSVQQRYPGGWDIATYTVPANHDGKAGVTIASNGNVRKVSNQTDSLADGWYCWAGRGIWFNDQLNERCGSQSISVTQNSKILDCIQRRTHPGDSGGPVYSLDSNGGAVAVGTMIGDFQNSVPTNHYACWAEIRNTNDALNYSLVYWK